MRVQARLSALAVCAAAGLVLTALSGAPLASADKPTVRDVIDLPKGDIVFKKAPSKFDAVFTVETASGENEAVVFTIHREWAPHAADRFYHLLHTQYFQGTRFNRIVPGFVAEFGLTGNPWKDKRWQKTIGKADPLIKIGSKKVMNSNINGTIAFSTSAFGCVRPPAKGGNCPALPKPRSSLVFINLGDNSFLDKQGYVPFGRVTLNFDVLASLGKAEFTMAQQSKLLKSGSHKMGPSYAKLPNVTRTSCRSYDWGVQGLKCV